MASNKRTTHLQKKLFKYIGKSQLYKYVYIRENTATKEIKYEGRVIGKTIGQHIQTFNTEREAAIFVDTILLQNNKPSVNILVLK